MQTSITTKTIHDNNNNKDSCYCDYCIYSLIQIKLVVYNLLVIQQNIKLVVQWAIGKKNGLNQCRRG